MASPTFNGNKIFDSLDASSTNFSEGVLWVQPAAPVLQTVRFEGEIGGIRLSHGSSDQEWTFEGLISATTITAFFTIMATLQTQLALVISAPSTYYTLVDSFGNVYDNAQITHMDPIAPHAQAGGGLVAAVRVTGICQGSTQYGSST
jgi:hypothetical protein